VVSAPIWSLENKQPNAVVVRPPSCVAVSALACVLVKGLDFGRSQRPDLIGRKICDLRGGERPTWSSPN